MPMTDIQDILDAVERVRAETHPELDARFLEMVVEAEQNHPDDDAAAMRAIESALENLLGARGTA